MVLVMPKKESDSKKPTELDRRIGRRIADARSDANRMTQEALANEIGVSGATVSRWESGIHQFAAAELVRIAEVLGKPVLWFYGLEPSEHRVAFHLAERLSEGERAAIQRLIDQFVAGR